MLGRYYVLVIEKEQKNPLKMFKRHLQQIKSFGKNDKDGYFLNDFANTLTKYVKLYYSH